MRKILGYKLTVICLLMISFYVPNAMANSKDSIHRVVMHVDDNDPKRMNLVLNNAANINNFYLDKGEEVIVEIVAYGPGLKMFLDNSPVKKRLKSISESYDTVSFMACGNTHRKMSKKAGKKLKLAPQAKMVPAGVIHIIQRQEEGWSYVRP